MVSVRKTVSAAKLTVIIRGGEKGGVSVSPAGLRS